MVDYEELSDHDKNEIDKFKLALSGKMNPVELREYEGYRTPKKICRYEIVEQFGFAVCKDCEHVVNTHGKIDLAKNWVCEECVEIWRLEELWNKYFCRHEPPLKWYKLKDNTRLCENCHKEINPRWLK